MIENELLTLIAKLAPIYPMNQDEQGGCVWCGCGSGRYVPTATPDHKSHAPDCPWVEADTLLNQHPEIKRPETDYTELEQ